MASPVRRVLGTKDSNAPLNIRSPQKNASILPTISSPTTHAHPAKSIQITAADSTLPHAGQKRKIEHVEDARDRDDGLYTSQRTEATNESGSETGAQMDTSDLSSFQKSLVDTSMTSFSASQGAPSMFESQFELPQDEMSQRTLDKLHAVPLPQNASQLPPVHAQLVKEMSLGSVGMSNFLNFEDNGSSQASDGLHVIEDTNKTQEIHEGTEHTGEDPTRSSVEDQEEQKRKEMLAEKADQLRTRLQLALFKVQTNQAGCPFSRLKAPAPPRCDLSSSPPSFMQRQHDRTPPNYRTSSTVKNLSSTTRFAVQDLAQHAISPESRISAFRAQATAQRKPPVAHLDSIPMPMLQPTGFSARWTREGDQTDQAVAEVLNRTINDSEEIAIDPDLENMQFPSSPPLSRSPSRTDNHKISEEAQHPSSQQHLQTVVEETMQLSSPPASDAGEDNDKDPNSEVLIGRDQTVEVNQSVAAPQGTNGKTELTSSPVKGEAANGLLQLMRASSDSL